MDKFFNTEGPVMLFLGRLADLVWLNILTIICCIPIITAGASITAMYTITIKMVKGEEGYITKGFFKAFKANFKQATIIWLIVLATAALLLGDYWIMYFSGMNAPRVLAIVFYAVFFVAYSTYLYLFPVLARYENTIKNIIKNSFLLCLSNFPKTLLLIAIQAIPYLVLYFFRIATPLVVMMGASSTAYLSSLIFVTIFKRLEEG